MEPLPAQRHLPRITSRDSIESGWESPKRGFRRAVRNGRCCLRSGSRSPNIFSENPRFFRKAALMQLAGRLRKRTIILAVEKGKDCNEVKANCKSPVYGNILDFPKNFRMNTFCNNFLKKNLLYKRIIDFLLLQRFFVFILIFTF